jgi:hypothetical protein
MAQKPTETAREVLGVVDQGLGLLDRILGWAVSPMARAANLRREAQALYQEAQKLPEGARARKRKLAKAGRKWRRAERLDFTGTELSAPRSEPPRDPSPS